MSQALKRPDEISVDDFTSGTVRVIPVVSRLEVESSIPTHFTGICVCDANECPAIKGDIPGHTCGVHS